MCFENNRPLLDKYRARDRSFIVWKLGDSDKKTGLARTQYGLKDTVWWIKGQIVKPHRILTPLAHKRCCSAGLYFYTAEKLLPAWRSHHDVIKARVKPEDVIGVNNDGEIICVTAALVLKAPQPNPRQQRIKWLFGRIKRAKQNIKSKDEQVKEWLGTRDSDKECLQMLVDEVEELEAGKSFQPVLKNHE